MGSATDHPPATQGEVLEANRRQYDRGLDPLLDLLVYGPLHEGWRFTSIGGATALGHAAHLSGLDRHGSVLEIGSGLGDTCRYLVSRYGCTATGVELNRWQVAAARAGLAEHPEQAARIELVEGDFLAWSPARPYDLVLAVDTLMMTADPGAFLRQAAAALRPGGVLSITEITAGPGLSRAARAYAWQEAGICTLLPASRYEDLMAELDLRLLERRTLDDLARGFFERLGAAVGSRRSQILDLGGPQALATWTDLVGRYGQLFAEGELRYSQMSARSMARLGRPR